MPCQCHNSLTSPALALLSWPHDAVMRLAGHGHPRSQSTKTALPRFPNKNFFSNDQTIKWAIALQRHVPVLLPRRRVRLVLQHLQRPDDPPPRLPRVYHVVDVPPLRRHIGAGEPLLVLLH